MLNNPINPLDGPLGLTAANPHYPYSTQYYPGNFPANSANPDYTGNYPANVGLPSQFYTLPSNQFYTPRPQSDGGPANPANVYNLNNNPYLYSYPARAWNWGLLPQSWLPPPVPPPAPPAPGSSLAAAIQLIQDQEPVEQQNVVVQQGVPFWIEWTALYDDEMDFYYCANGLFSASNSLSNYAAYQPDGVTTIDLSGGNVQSYPQDSGPDPLSRESQFAYINYLFQGGQTYYLSFIPLVSGPVGIFILGD